MRQSSSTAKYFTKLMALGIYSPIQALYYFPKSIQYIKIQPFSTALSQGFFRGIVQGQPRIVRYRKVPFVQFRFLTNNQVIPVIAFNQTYLAKTLVPGSEIVLSAKKSQRNWVASKVFTRNIQDLQHESEYNLLKGMRQAKFREYLRNCLVEVKITNFLPDDIHAKYQLIDRKKAFMRMHFPESEEEQQEAIRYFKYEEAFLFYLQLFMRQKEMQHAEGNDKGVALGDVAQFKQALPFTLTGAQDRVIKEIVHDMNEPHIMHRLLQGDVGSGKTIIALLAAYLQVKQGYQAVFLAPTTVLAQQHLREAEKYLAPLGIKIRGLRSQMKKTERATILQELASGELEFLIGTHALLEEDVKFKNLGLAIIDEQQRFGVEQRKILRKKGQLVDMLYMSATPIPRTLAISVFGNLGVSTIDELPAGRQKIHTEIIRKKQWTKVLNAIIATIRQGEQVYVVCPLIEASEQLDLGNLEQLHQMLVHDLPADVSIAMLHGKQKNEEKQATIDDFVAEKIQVLVSTTVIEVGVHVDKATLMIIYDAQQFGLSQLHQLRGRVGRSSRQANCILVSDHDNKRLELLTTSQDGFFLAQQDLLLRGPGDFFGQKQSGLPMFKLVNLLEDFKLLEVMKAEVAAILLKMEEMALQVEEIDDYERNQYTKIEQYMELREKQMTDFID